MPTTRFAPSPTGPLHLGHAYAAWFAREAAAGGRYLVRLEDLDRTRWRPEYEAGVMDDLAWLGLAGEGEPVRQSERAAAYREALDKFRDQGLLYPCFCTRKDIEALAGAPQGPDGPRYPGTCRTLSPDEARVKMSEGRAYAWRLRGEDLEDVVLARKDGVVAYHLAVVVDDAWQGVELVTRGRDLESSTPIHRRLQDLLGLPTPRYQHHGLVVDEAGKRLAKRDDARALRLYRDQGMTPREVIALAIESLEDPTSRP